MRFKSAIRTTQILGLSLFNLGLVYVVKPAVSGAQVCNFHGCSAPGAGECNFHGCPNPGAGECNFHGCPAAPPATNSNPPASSSSQSSRSFQIVNYSGSEFYYFYASPAGQSSWSNDVLGNNTLPNGQAWNLTLDRGCQYDFQARTQNGSTMTWQNIDVCSRSSTTLNR